MSPDSEDRWIYRLLLVTVVANLLTIGLQVLTLRQRAQQRNESQQAAQLERDKAAQPAQLKPRP